MATSPMTSLPGGPTFAPLPRVPEAAPAPTVATSGWRRALPLLQGAKVTLRELQASDAASLHAMLTTEEVTRFISPPPTTVEGFERFITCMIQQRQEGRAMCFGIVPHGLTVAVGIIQVRYLDGGSTAEWGFALGSPFWGTGLFVDGAREVLAFLFTQTDLQRLEARAAVPNGRGNGALKKLGSVAEGVLRAGLRRGPDVLDQVMWSMLREDWLAIATPVSCVVH